MTNVFYLVMIFYSSQILAQQAPNFTLVTEAGQNISLSDYQGKPLVLHFWATWCPYCKMLQPGLDALYLKYQDQGLEMLSISFWQEGDATPQAELIARGMHFKTVVNRDKVAKQYQVSGTPSTFFISKTGVENNIQLRHSITSNFASELH